MRESRSSGSAEGVVSNRDPYSDSPEPMVVKQPQFTRVEEPTLLCNHWFQLPIVARPLPDDCLRGFQADFSLLLGTGFADPDHAAALPRHHPLRAATLGDRKAEHSLTPVLG